MSILLLVVLSLVVLVFGLFACGCKHPYESGFARPVLSQQNSYLRISERTCFDSEFEFSHLFVKLRVFVTLILIEVYILEMICNMESEFLISKTHVFSG